MNSKHHKTDARILARSNAAKRRNLHLKYIALKDRRKNRSEPALTKSGENTGLHKTSRERVKKAPVIANHHVTNKNPQLLQKYPDVIKQSPNVVKKAIEVKNVSNVQKDQKFVANSVTKRASMKSKQPRPKQGGFTEKIVSMWHYAKSFLGLSNSNRQNTKNYSMENKKSKQSLPVKPKRAIYVAKKPLIHHNYKDLKESKNFSANQYHRYDKTIEKRKIIIDGIKTPLVLPASKVNQVNPNVDLQHENNSKFNRKEQIVVAKEIVLKDKSKKDQTDDMKSLQRADNKLTVNIKANENEEVEVKKQDITVEMDTNQSLQYENKPMVNIKTNEKEPIKAVKQIVLNDKPKKDIQIDTNTDQCFQHENKLKVNIKANGKEQIEEDKQMVLKDKPMKDITLEVNTNRPLREILTNANCYKSTLDGNNATIIIEIKNVSNNVPKDNKQIQPQTLNVNCAIETLDVHKNAENCKKNVLTLLNTSNVKLNITQLTTRGHVKVPTNNVKKPLSKVRKIQNNLDKKKQPLAKKQKKCPKTHHHEDTNRRVRHRHRSCKRYHHHHDHRTKYNHKHNCRNHKTEHTTQRKCSTCRGYISTDDSQQGKAHHGHHKDKYDYKERCRVCKKRVTCLYHHNKKYHKHYHVYDEKKTISHKHHKDVKSSKKHSTPKKNRSFHNYQKKKRTLTVCTNSRRNSFKNKKLKRSVTYMSTQMKLSTSEILPKYKNSNTNNSIPYTYVNFKRSDSSIFRTDSDSDSDRQEATKVLSWWYLHYALNAVQQNPNDEIPTQSDDIRIPYGEFCNVYEAVSKVSTDSDDSSINENWNENFDAKTRFPRHPNSFTDEETMVSENIYPTSSVDSSTHNFEDLNM